MTSSQQDTTIYRLKPASYRRTHRIAWLLIAVSFVGALLCILLSIKLFPTYTHTFTPYLKWQDALFATFVFTALLGLGSSVLVLRFLYALRAGYTTCMLQLQGRIFTGRDLSPKNLTSIYWLVSTVFGCFIAALVGLVPLILIGWTLHLPNPLLVVLGTALASLLSLAGLVVTAIALAFVVIGFAGSISFSRKMGSPQTYDLTQQASISIVREQIEGDRHTPIYPAPGTPLQGFVLSIIYPDQPESLFDLNLLEPADARHLLLLLHQRWLTVQSQWNPTLGQEIAEALREADRASLAV